MPAGRPTRFSPDTGTEICQQIAEGDSLRKICAQEKMPSKSTVLRWLMEGEMEGAKKELQEFRDQYASARQIQAELLVDEMRDIADDGSNDWMEVKHGDATFWRVNGEAINRSRLRIDTRKWVAVKLLPKKYGEKLETTHKGDPAAPIVISNTVAKW